MWHKTAGEREKNKSYNFKCCSAQNRHWLIVPNSHRSKRIQNTQVEKIPNFKGNHWENETVDGEKKWTNPATQIDGMIATGVDLSPSAHLSRTLKQSADFSQVWIYSTEEKQLLTQQKCTVSGLFSTAPLLKCSFTVTDRHGASKMRSIRLSK